MPASYAVLFKIHFWDDFAQRQLDRLKASVGRGDIYIFVDETNGRVAHIDHPERFVLRATEADLADQQLPSFGHYSQFWWSADYALLLLHARVPDYDFYVMTEFDVVVNAALDGMIDIMESEGADFVADPIRDPPIEQFHWLPSAEGVYRVDQMQAWLTCISFFSRAALETLLQSKRTLGRRLASGEISTLPMCEIAIPTALAIEGLALVPLSRFGNVLHYRWTPPYDEGDLPNLTGSTFVHPVLAGRRFVGNLLKWYPDHTHFLDPHSSLRERFKSPEAIEAAIPVLYAEWRAAGRRDLCDRLLILMPELVRPEFLRAQGAHRSNLARSGRATQSSWFGEHIRLEDSQEAVRGIVTGAAAFHTCGEPQPWWMLDLLRVHEIGEIRVFNRIEHRERADNLIVRVASEPTSWREVGRHAGASFGGADGRPFVARVDGPARFVHLSIPGNDFLHLDQVQVLARNG